MYQRFVLGILERRTLQTSLKDRVTIDATGMYIPIRAHFKLLLEMGLGYLHIQRGVEVARSGDIASSTATGCGTSNDKTPRFSFIPHYCHLESMAEKADGSNI